MEIIEIKTDFIKLQQVLKLAGMIDAGSDAKYYISEGMVKVNGVVATERGKKIRNNDIVEVEGIGKIQIKAPEMWLFQAL